MRISPLELERAPRSRFFEWLYFRNEQALYDNWRAEEATMRMGRVN
jgi:hypothetical protein